MGMSVCNQTFLLPQCAARSVGPANQLFIQLIQTLVAAHCSIPQPNIWPEDYGSIAKKHGTVFLIDFSTIRSNFYKKKKDFFYKLYFLN